MINLWIITTLLTSLCWFVSLDKRDRMSRYIAAYGVIGSTVALIVEIVT